MGIKKNLTTAAIAFGALTAATSAFALTGVGLTANQTLIGFKTGNPAVVQTGPALTGFVGTDTALVGIDYRVQNGLLYGVGNGGGVYTVDTSTGVLTFVNSLSVTLNAASFYGVDFNPAADRLRIVSSSGQNLRHNVNVGGVTLSDLATNAPTTTPGVSAAVLNIGGAAYTNNDLNTTSGTTLFNINTNNSMVTIQSPPNDGTQVGTGALGVTATLSSVGFDIYSRLIGDKTDSNVGYAALTNAAGVTSGYDVNLATGAATLRGAFPATLLDIALKLN